MGLLGCAICFDTYATAKQTVASVQVRAHMGSTGQSPASPFDVRSSFAHACACGRKLFRGLPPIAQACGHRRTPSSAPTMPAFRVSVGLPPHPRFYARHLCSHAHPAANCAGLESLAAYLRRSPYVHSLYLYNDVDHSVRQVTVDVSAPWGPQGLTTLGTPHASLTVAYEVAALHDHCRSVVLPRTTSRLCVVNAGASVAHGKLHELRISDKLPVNGEHMLGSGFPRAGSAQCCLHSRARVRCAQLGVTHAQAQ